MLAYYLQACYRSVPTLEVDMAATALLMGDRDEIEKAARDPRIEAAEAALDRFERTGAVRDASAYAYFCYSLVHEIVHQQFPHAVRGDALQMAAVKVIGAGLSAGIDPHAPGGWLVWSLAHELRDLATSYGVPVKAIRPPRPHGARGRGRASITAGFLGTLTQEVIRLTGSVSALEEIQQTFGLSSAETASLFGVRRQAVDQWRKNGVPSSRVADVERVRDVARVLYEELIPERIPQIVRTPAAGLDGRSILQVLAGEDGVDRVRGYLARLYAFESR
jgi:uncharacterized protein (DUF2384 family)